MNNRKNLIAVFLAITASILLTILVVYTIQNVRDHQALPDLCERSQPNYCTVYSERGFMTLLGLAFLFMPLLTLAAFVATTELKKITKILLALSYMLPYVASIALSVFLLLD